MVKPVAVLISDVHFNINTMDVASKAVTMSINKAIELNVDLIVCGDLHDTKAHIRGECVIAMQKAFTRRGFTVHVLRGNHDSLNEKSTEHSLHCLPINCIVYAEPEKLEHTMVHTMGVGYPDAYLIPYYHDADELREYLKTIPKGSTLIMHQGIQGSNSGEYFQDKSAIRPEDVAGFRVISGHYHNRQTIQLPDGGTWDYVGNPYTLNFAEANDPEKGFQILYSNGSLEFIPTNLRKHVVINSEAIDGCFYYQENALNPIRDNDIVWVKVSGTAETLKRVTKEKIKTKIGLAQDFKLELIPNDIKADIDIKSISQSQPELLDSLIQSLTNVSEEQKKRLKAIWKDLAE